MIRRSDVSRVLTPLVHLALVALAAAPLACSSGKSAEERQLDELRSEITKVQSESDKFEERLGKLEVDSADRPDPVVARGPATTLAAPMATPRLRVVHLGSDGEEEAIGAGETAGALSAPQADDGARVRIQGSGSDAAIVGDKGPRPRRAQDSGGATTSFTNANLGPSLATHSASRPSALDEDAKQSYDAALHLVNAKRYPEALDALAGFLVNWPDHPNADNAMYWRGECYFAQGAYDDAAKEFEGLLARFPMGNKAPDALLKLGLSEMRQGDAATARQRFDRLRREFPHSDAAKRIPAGAQTVIASPSAARSAPGDKP
jgi:tol-pal system protein YbgF